MENEKTAAFQADEKTETTAEQIKNPLDSATEEAIKPMDNTGEGEGGGNQPKTYTEEEFNQRLDEVIGRKLARREAKVRREYDRKYGEIENVLKAGTGKDNLDDIAEEFRRFYEQKGTKIPESQSPRLSDRDLEILARADAEDIIRSGYDEVVEEVDRLAKIGADHMTQREKTVFRTLAEHRKESERDKELSRIGIDEKVYGSKDFRDFSAKFISDVPVSEIYKLYAKTTKQENAEPIGSMKNGSHDDVKTYYSPEDVDKLTEKDLDNPVIFQRVRESMKSWK